MSIDNNERPIEAGIHTDLSGRMTYGGYLHLDRLLSAQQPLSQAAAPRRNAVHRRSTRSSELWMKLLIHELRAAIAHLQRDELGPCQKIFARCKAVLRQLTEMWSVLETLTPSEYMEFRHILGPSSGFQSLQYRTMEFLLGNKNAAMLKVFAHDAAGLRRAARGAGVAEPVRRRHCATSRATATRCRRMRCSATGRKPHVFDPALVPVFERIYEDSDTHWVAYQLCEDLVDLETQFQLWRFRHMRTVMRIIGFKRGTGGSSGVGFLKQALELTFFPELFEVRTVIGATPSAGY